MSYMSEERSKLEHPDYWDREPNTWGSIKDWDFYFLQQVNKRISHSALSDELRCLKQIYDENHPTYKAACHWQDKLKKNDSKFWEKKEQISSLLLEADVAELELEIAKKRGRIDVHQIARRGYKEYSDIEFGPKQNVQKKIKPNKPNENIEEVRPISSDVSRDSQDQAQQQTSICPPTFLPKITDRQSNNWAQQTSFGQSAIAEQQTSFYHPIIGPEPSNLEFDRPKPSWLNKLIEQQKFLASKTDPYKRYKSPLNSIWWRIIDVSDPNTSNVLTAEELTELGTIFSSALKIDHPTESWKILEPAAERCLQTLSKLDNNQLCKIGKIVQLEGSHGAIREIQKMAKDTQDIDTIKISASLFGDEDMNKNVKSSFLVEEEDYLNSDVQFILDLVRFTCEMLEKYIPQRKKPERDIDIFIKRHVFSCFDDIVNSKLGMILSYDRVFPFHECTGSIIENGQSNTLKAQKVLRDMHKTLVEAISAEGGGMVSKNVLRATTKLLIPGFLSQDFFIRAFLVVYIGNGFYLSTNLADINIPTMYSELGSIIKISRIMLQVKKLLNLTVCNFKIIMERADKENFGMLKYHRK